MDLKKHYTELYRKYGDDSKAVQYSDEKSQTERFKILCGIDPHLQSVVDVGCGLAHLYSYLQSTGFTGKYCGLDFVPDFIAANKEKYAHDDQTAFSEFDITSQEIPSGYDYIMLSGVFNNLMDDNETFMLHAIRKMFDAAAKGVAFNAMSTYVDFQADNLYYSDPLRVFDFCKRNITKKVTLRHDYLVKENSIPFEYAIYLYK